MTYSVRPPWALCCHSSGACRVVITIENFSGVPRRKTEIDVPVCRR